MKHMNEKIKGIIYVMLLALSLISISRNVLAAGDSTKAGKLFVRDNISKDTNVSWKDGLNVDYSFYGLYQGQAMTYNIGFLCFDSSIGTKSFSVKSSDPSVVTISGIEANPDNGDTTGKSIYYNYMFNITINNYCDTMVTVKYGNDTYTIRCRFFPQTTVITGITPAGKNSAIINFQKVTGADGYYVFKREKPLSAVINDNEYWAYSGGWTKYCFETGDISSIKISKDWEDKLADKKEEQYIVCPGIFNANNELSPVYKRSMHGEVNVPIIQIGKQCNNDRN